MVEFNTALLDDTPRTNVFGGYTETPVEDYTLIESSYQIYRRWINGYGYQEPDTNGDYSGSYPAGLIPPGQSRLARTMAAQFVMRATHAGFGDGYTQYSTMGVTAHPGVADVTAWDGQNSGGLYNGQVGALSDKVNLYVLGDLVATDNGHTDVSMFGNVNILYRNGANSGAYSVPRVNLMLLSLGTQDIDSPLIVKGAYAHGLDLAGGDYTTAAALVTKSGQYWNLNGTEDESDGNYAADSVGSVRIGYVSSSIQVHLGTNDSVGVRVYGSSASSFISLGQWNTNSYLTAGSTGADTTALVFQAAASGVETEGMRLLGTRALVLTPPTNAQTLGTNGTVTIEFTSDTTLTFRGRGSDGTTRTGTITLT